MADASVISDPGQVTPAWLSAILRGSGLLADGEVSAVREVGRDTAPDAVVRHLEVSYRGYVRLPGRLLLKLPAAAGAGDHEVTFYQQVVPPMQLTRPPAELPFLRHFDVACSGEGRPGHLLLEDLWLTHTASDGALPPTLPHSEGIVDALACLHAFWWEHPRLGQDIGGRPTVAGIQALVASAGPNLAQLFDFAGDRISPGRRATYERICHAWPARRVERLVAGRGITLVSGDAGAGNFLYPRDTLRDRVRIVNWENWHVAAGADDLACLIAPHWYPERRARLEKPLVGRYHSRLQEYGVTGYGWDDCWYDYLASIIRVLFGLLGGWQPGRAPSLWFDRAERATLAYEGLGCAALLP
jgi:hypothetical protein